MNFSTWKKEWAVSPSSKLKSHIENGVRSPRSDGPGVYDLAFQFVAEYKLYERPRHSDCGIQGTEIENHARCPDAERWKGCLFWDLEDIAVRSLTRTPIITSISRFMPRAVAKRCSPTQCRRQSKFPGRRCQDITMYTERARNI
ncbi:hypothetical protein VN97_g4571 [Penicillium thymicola]|uniref:Uncharacterized protein n=1 Tax=Penicillium thymicola TaxID=293382 RepID=A0AAI9TLJ8_PENTH|nr:hypothetical protein VN97_g4571 [Penicillium thymicola]